MTSRDLTRGTEESCRQKALAHVEELESRFTPSTTDEEKFDAYLQLHDRTANGLSRCRENFEGDHYLRFQFDPALGIALETANRTGVVTLEILQERMKSLTSAEGKNLTQHNGTSASFAKCSSILVQSKVELAEAEQIITDKLLAPVIGPVQPAPERILKVG